MDKDFIDLVSGNKVGIRVWESDNGEKTCEICFFANGVTVFTLAEELSQIFAEFAEAQASYQIVQKEA